MIYYRKDSRPRRVFTSNQFISYAQTLRTQFQSQPIFGPPVNFASLRSHLLIVYATFLADSIELGLLLCCQINPI